MSISEGDLDARFIKYRRRRVFVDGRKRLESSIEMFRLNLKNRTSWIGAT